MDIEEIIDNGFIRAFFIEYYEHKIHSFYPDKDRLLYVLCDSELEKRKVTNEQIQKTKIKIKELGFEGISFAYLLSCKESSEQNYIEPNERYDFWLERFLTEYEENIYSFKPIRKALLNFYNTDEIDKSCFENTDDFWNFYPKSEKPNTSSLQNILELEKELEFQIELIIEEYKQNEWWEIDFEEFEKFIPISKPIELLFKISELFVQLNRLEMFTSFLEIEKAPKERNKTSVLEMKDALAINHTNDEKTPFRDQAYWIEVFNNIDTNQKQKVIVRILGSKKLECGAYDEGSFNLTVEYLKKFKENTELLSPKRTLQYIDQLKIKKPNSPTTDSKLFNQTVFNAENSYYEFIEDYKLHLEENILIEKLQQTLNNIGSITEKLDYLEEQKTDFKTHNLISPLRIPESIYKDHFSDGLKLPEFTYWFLKFNAKELFSYTINSKDFNSKLNSTLKKEFIQAQLNELKEAEKNAKKLLLKREVDIFNKNHPNSYKYLREITLLKVLDGNYYKENIINSPHAWGSLEIQYYFKHIFFKSHLENLLQKTVKLESPENSFSLEKDIDKNSKSSLPKIDSSKMESKQNIISTLNYQLGKISHLFEEQVSKDLYRYNFFINDTDVKFLNVDELERYIIEAPIYNTGFLKGIVQKSLDIINLWNEKIAPVVLGETEKPQPDIKNDIYCFTIHKDDWIGYYNTVESVKLFKEKFQNNIKRLDCASIARKCSLIIEYITACYPEIKKSVENELVLKPKKKSQKNNVLEPKVFEDLFYNPDHAKHCIGILKDLEIINSKNEYIFKGKGIFPLWIKLLKNNDPAIVKHFSDKKYSEILNSKFINLNLTDDASEFRKTYKRIDNSDYDLQIKSLISQLSQEGKLGN